MAELSFKFNQVMDYPHIKLEGDLTVNSFAAMHLVVKGATKFGTVPVIVDLSGDLHISDGVKEIRCWRSPAEVPAFAREVVLFIISTNERLGEIKALLTPHKLQHTESLQDAIDILTKTTGEVS